MRGHENPDEPAGPGRSRGSDSARRRRARVRLASLGALIVAAALTAFALGSSSDGTSTASSSRSWSIVLQPEQRDPQSAEGNRYSYGWVKSVRPSPERPQWQREGLLVLADYPDTFVMIERKRFERGAVGRTTNFHLTGGDEVHNGVSPLSADYQASPSPDWPKGVRPGLVLTAEASLAERRRGHWQLLTAAEITRDPNVIWTLVWRIRWGTEGRGSVTVTLIRDRTFFRTVRVPSLSTVYTDQQPRLYVWLGSYVSTGVGEATAMTQSLDQRGRTLEEALADRPRLGSTIHSSSSAGGPDSSVAHAKVFPPLDAEVVRAAVLR